MYKERRKILQIIRHRTHCANSYEIVIHTIWLLEPWSLEIVLHKSTYKRKCENKLFRINCIRMFEFQKAFVMMIRLLSTEQCFSMSFIEKDACDKAYNAQNIMGYIRCNMLSLRYFKIYINSVWFENRMALKNPPRRHYNFHLIEKQIIYYTIVIAIPYQLFINASRRESKVSTIIRQCFPPISTKSIFICEKRNFLVNWAEICVNIHFNVLQDIFGSKIPNLRIFSRSPNNRSNTCVDARG